MSENDFWFFVKTPSATNPVERKTCFDMRTVFFWEGIKTLKNEPMVFRVYLSFRPNDPIILNATEFDSFALAWDKYTKIT